MNIQPAMSLLFLDTASWYQTTNTTVRHHLHQAPLDSIKTINNNSNLQQTIVDL